MLFTEGINASLWIQSETTVSAQFTSYPMQIIKYIF